MIKIINVKSNGKLYIVGEYNVLRPKGKSIILGINKGINFSIEESNSFSFFDRGKQEKFNYDKEVSFLNNDRNTLRSAINETFKYLEFLNVEIKTFNIKIENELTNDEGIKYGLGSSSAIITGTIKSILLFHDSYIDEIQVFKIAVIASIKSDQYSSGGDLAASLFTGLIYYRRYNLKFVLKNIENNIIYTKKWPDLKIVKIKSDLIFLGVWTKESYKTKPLEYIISKKEYKQAQSIVRKTYKSIINNQFYDFKQNITKYQKWLEDILSLDNLVTDKIKTALEITKTNYLTGKISGAGGGDSIIVVKPSGYNMENYISDLEDNDLELLDL